MAKLSASKVFDQPTFRHFLAVVAGLWLGLGILLAIVSTSNGNASTATDPLVTPVFYLILFGGGSLWVRWQYHRHHIELKTLVGRWPHRADWPYLIGLWVLLFMFSLGAFQVSFVLLSYVLPEFVTTTLNESLFLGAGETTIPWLYNLLMVFLLVVAAPVLEEFLFRGFLQHRWGTRWNPPVAILLSSILFGILHGNVIGLTMFGLVMALLYFRTSSLGVAIAVHALNNAIAVSLELITRLTGHSEPTSLADFRSGVWFGAILLAVSIPFLAKFIRRNWPNKKTPLPYWVNRNHALTR
ncbi:MAG: CPBP family intramembrane metalloprotease [Leptolyngbya sp. SIOISBB]|nr:CPBP family intramembrane metalloprotease [Leptolyngbya sp. SIOISBB]